MATKPSASSASRPIGPAIIGIALVALVLFVGWLAYANLLAPPKSAQMSKQAQENNDWMKQMAKKSGGDVGKLSPEEQAKLRQMTGGYGAIALQHMAKEK